MNKRFEAAWEEWNGAPAVATSSWAGGALAALHFAGVAGRDRAVPVEHVHGDAAGRRSARARASSSSTATATTSACRSTTSRRTAERHKPKAAFLVHIGGHIAFEVEQIAAYCAENGIFLIEDCAHAHGAVVERAASPGSYGDAGVYSLYATKTVSTGEGGVLVSKRPEVLEYARGFRNYGKPTLRGSGPQLPHERVHGGARADPGRADARDRRVEERGRARVPGPAVPGAARAPRRDGLGAVQVHRVRLAREVDRPRLRRAVPPDPGPQVDLPNTDWVARNHSCPPLYYRTADRTTA